MSSAYKSKIFWELVGFDFFWSSDLPCPDSEATVRLEPKVDTLWISQSIIFELSSGKLAWNGDIEAASELELVEHGLVDAVEASEYAFLASNAATERDGASMPLIPQSRIRRASRLFSKSNSECLERLASTGLDGGVALEADRGDEGDWG